MAALRLAALPIAVIALALSPAPAIAQAKGAPAPSQAMLKQSAANFNVLMGALQSDKVPQVVKNILFACIYGNPFGKISDGTDKVLAEKKVDHANPNNVVSAMAAVCGLKPDMLKQPAKK